MQWVDAVDYTVDGRSAEAFYKAIRTYWPGLPDGFLKPSFAGIRPKVPQAGLDLGWVYACNVHAWICLHTAPYFVFKGRCRAGAAG